MLAVLGVGAVIGVMWGALRQGQAEEGQQSAEDAATMQQQQQQQQRQQQQQHQELVPLQDNPSQQKGRLGNARTAAAAVGGVVCLAAAAALSIRLSMRRRPGRNRPLQSRRTDGRIPLKDLIRFKERQWFVEELELARDADPMSMIRLAKMYLNGQGCQRNIALAQEWVRKARSMGVPATLDELYATDDPDPHTKLRQLAALEERRRALRQLNSSTASSKAGHRHTPSAAAQRPTAAA